MFFYQKQISNIFLIFLFVFTFSYGIYRLYPLIYGPEIKLNTPTENFFETNKEYITISGESKRLSRLYINGSKIDMDKNGYFSTLLAIYSGNNILIIEGYDRFERLTTIKKNIFKNN